MHRLVFAAVTLGLLTLTWAPSAAAQDLCGSDRVEEIVPGLIYKVTSLAWSPNPSAAGANIYVFKRTAGPGGQGRVIVYGMGNGDGVGQGSDDFFAYTGRRPLSQAVDDVDAILGVVTAPDCFDLPLGAEEPVGGRFVIQHAHLDHANQEFIEAVKATDLAPVSFHYHAADHQLLTCEGTFEGQELSDEAYCGFIFGGPEEQNPFRGHPFELPIVPEDWAPIGSEDDTPCAEVLGSFGLADGRIARIVRDDGHTSGGLNIVLDPVGGAPGLAFLSTTVGAARCKYPGYEAHIPHQG